VPAPPLTPLAAAVLRLDRPPERVLVLGCGDGDPVLFLAREFPAARVRGLDRSEDGIRAATARVGLDPEGRVAFKHGGGRSIPFPDEHFDLLVALDLKPSPGEVRRVLRPGGNLLLVATGSGSGLVPDSGWLWRRLRRRGVEPVRHETAGAGSFSFGRFVGGEQTPASI
jgi:ubiquinone/menaquinone biosynthesis C-methylase UbiE